MSGDDKLYTAQLNCSPQDKRRLMEECKVEFIRHHPELEGQPLSQGFILRRVIEYYLNERPFGSDHVRR